MWLSPAFLMTAMEIKQQIIKACDCQMDPLQFAYRAGRAIPRGHRSQTPGAAQHIIQNLVCRLSDSLNLPFRTFPLPPRMTAINRAL